MITEVSIRCQKTRRLVYGVYPRIPPPNTPLAVSSPVGSGAEPQRKSNLVRFSLKIWHLVASNLLIFLRINWPQCVHFSTCVFVHFTSFTKVDVNVKVLVCQLICPAAARSVGPVPRPVPVILLEWSFTVRMHLLTATSISTWFGFWVREKTLEFSLTALPAPSLRANKMRRHSKKICFSLTASATYRHVIM